MAKYGLKIKEKADILAYGYFEKRGNQLKRGTLTPLYNILCYICSCVTG